MTQGRIVAVLLGALVGSMGLGTITSCEPAKDDPGDAEARPDNGGVRVEPNPADGVRADFVIDSLRIGDLERGEGFNLDGVVTPAGDPDEHPDGPGGVDNQLGSLLQQLKQAGMDIDPEEEIRTSLQNGELIMLLSHRDVDSWTTDPGWVPLFAYAGKDADDPEDPTNNFTGRARFLIHPDSLTDPTNEDSALVAFPRGVFDNTEAADRSLQKGDFEAGPAEFTVDLSVQEDRRLRLELKEARIVWDLETAPEGRNPALGGRIRDGIIGGYILLADAARAIAQLDPDQTRVDPDTIRNILQQQTDLDMVPEGFTDDPCSTATAREDCGPAQTCEPDRDRGGEFFCYEHPDTRDAISVGLAFTAVSCEIVGIAPR